MIKTRLYGFNMIIILLRCYRYYDEESKMIDN